MSTTRYDKFGGMWSLWSSDILVPGHFGPLAGLVCRIVAGNCNGVRRVSRVRLRFRVKVRIMDGCVQEMKCLRTEVTVHQFGSIYHT